MRRFFVFLLVIACANQVEKEVFAQTGRSISFTKTYTSNGTFTLTDISDIPDFDPDSEIFAVAEVEVLLVGGGGGGGRGYSAGGGGGGEVKSVKIDLNLGASLEIIIGQGGLGAGKTGNNSNNGNPGQNTVVKLKSGSKSIGYTANGGEGGLGNGNGGANGNGNAGGKGNGSGQNSKGGGGGGAGGLGTDGSGTGVTSKGGDGGVGIDGFGAGGGGNGRNGGSGGSGGGGNANPSGIGEDGSSNSGSGGGGGRPSFSGGNGSRGIVEVNITYRILPVQFLYFNTSYLSQNKTAFLDWSTAQEWGNSHFEIERAVNTVSEWETIAHVEGAGYWDTPIEYEYQDLNLPLAGGNVFYRLKQVDYSSNYNYSVTRAIQVPSQSGSESWLAYPNPSAKTMEVHIELINPELYQDQLIFISLSNLLGNSKVFTITSPKEISKIVSSWLQASPSGLYFLDIAWGNQVQQIKLLRN